MNIGVFLIECLLLMVIFTFAILIPLCKNPVWWIHDFPKDIQEEYFKTHERIPAAPLSKPALIKKSLVILPIAYLLSWLARWCGAVSFVQGFLFSYALWLVLDWYDCFILDCVFFANLKKIRLPGTEHMDQAYHQKKYHVVHSIVGMVVGVIPCLLAGLFIR